MRLPLFLLVMGTIALGQTYRLRSVVTDAAGRRTTSSGYQLQFSLAQTFASGVLSCSGYLGTIGFWHGLALGGIVTEHDDISPSCVTLDVSPSIVRGYLVVSYSLPEESDVSLRLLDRLGRVVKMLVSCRQRPGEYRVRCDGAANTVGFPEGIYFIQLRAGGRVVTRKLVVSR